MKECADCTAVQMLVQSKNNPPGVVFIYDLSHHVIRKFNVFTDSTCAKGSLIQGNANRTQQAQDRGDGSVTCGSFRDAEEVTPIDVGVQNIFDALYHAWQVNPSLADTAKSEPGPVPADPGNHNLPFDLPGVAWDYPQGSFVRFKQVLQQIVSSQATANAYVDGLGDYIHGVSVQVGSVIVALPPTVGVQIDMDRSNATIYLPVCNAADDCAQIEIKVSGGHVVDVVLDGVFDAAQMMYPSESGQMPGGLTAWHWHQHGDADHFREGLIGDGVNVPAVPGCDPAHFTFKLIVARVNGQVDSATWQCVPKP